MKGEIVVLVHGFFKGPRDMNYLARGLKDAGFETFSPDLPTTLGSLEDCVDSLRIQVSGLEGAGVIHYVAHSMGGLIIRAYLAGSGARNVSRCVFISTPHGGSGLAAIAEKIPFYSSVFQPVQAILPGRGYQRFKKKGQFRLGIIAGNRNSGVLGKLFLKGPGDGRVEVDCASAEDADEFLVLPFGHKDIHHQYRTLVNVAEFLRCGSFKN
ncbi:MAG: esterase/lipase family protein [Desulfonatronovibrio sp.]